MLTTDQLKQAWIEVFPDSVSSASTVLRDIGFRGFVAKDRTEVANNIMSNDPLNYVVIYNITTGDFQESNAYLLVAPTSPYMVYSSVKLRKKTIKNATYEQVVKRFQQVREFVMANKDNMIKLHFDINSK
jgi:hypothetical protein